MSFIVADFNQKEISVLSIAVPVPSRFLNDPNGQNNRDAPDTDFAGYSATVI
jgi:hypothetical protein